MRKTGGEESDHIREVVVHDKLGIAAELETMLQHLVDTYECEWAATVRDPEKRKWFRQFANTDDTQSCIEIISEREQNRPANWPQRHRGPGAVSHARWPQLGSTPARPGREPVGLVSKVGCVSPQLPIFQSMAEATIKYGQSQIAVFNFTSRGQWYACQNMCPHKKAFVLSRGILGDDTGQPKIACPLHKKSFSLETGMSLQSEEFHIRTFPVRIDGNDVYLELPPTDVLDALLATEIGCKLATSW